MNTADRFALIALAVTMLAAVAAFYTNDRVAGVVLTAMF